MLQAVESVSYQSLAHFLCKHSHLLVLIYPHCSQSIKTVKKVNLNYFIGKKGLRSESDSQFTTSQKIGSRIRKQ